MKILKKVLLILLIISLVMFFANYKLNAKVYRYLCITENIKKNTVITIDKLTYCKSNKRIPENVITDIKTLINSEDKYVFIGDKLNSKDYMYKDKFIKFEE